MLKKFFLQLIILAIIICFFGLNFDTKISIKFWFSDKLTLENISLFAALGAAYILGVLTFIPLYIAKNINNKKKEKKENKYENEKQLENDE